MSPLRRLGDLVKYSEDEQKGEHRPLPGTDRLASKIFFPDHLQLNNYYLFSSPLMKPENFDLPEDISSIGQNEANFISKLLDPPLPILCVEGALGSGKSTILKFVIHNVLEKIDCTHCQETHNHSCQRLIAWIDCKQFTELLDPKYQNGTLIQQLCIQLWARASKYLTEKIEFIDFWNYILENYDHTSDLVISNVAGCLLIEDPSIQTQMEIIEPNDLSRRKEIREKLRQSNLTWYFNYLVLLWRYLLESRFNRRKDCGLIVLDNVDSLHPDIQYQLLDYINRNTHQDGPTFILPMRPETRRRHSINDVLADITFHKGPTPIDVIFDRLNRFNTSPVPYLDAARGLNAEQKSLVQEYIGRIYQKLQGDKYFNSFIKAATGESVRNSLVIAQSLINGVTISEMRNQDITPHFVIRACINKGHNQFRAENQKRINNLFDALGIEENHLLLKPRILGFLIERKNQCTTPLLINAFSLFGYSKDSLRAAVNDLLRLECALLTSNGFDYFHDSWGNDQETLFLTDVGRGYKETLLYEVDFVQEVMLDTRVNSDDFPPEFGLDHLAEKFTALYYFLRALQKADDLEVRRFIRTYGARRYITLFGKRMITLDMLWKITPAVERILISSARKNLQYDVEYKDLIQRFISLVRIAENSNSDLLGILDYTYTSGSG